MTDDLIRLAAVVAAVALVAGPYVGQAGPWLLEAWKRGKPYAGTAGRAVAACLILWAAWGRLPSLPSLPTPPAPPAVDPTVPPDQTKVIVRSVADALRSLPAADRALWRDAWTKVGIVVAAEATAREPAFRDTRELRAYTGLAIDIAWRRIGGHAAGSQESLRKAVEAAYAAAVGTDDVPATADIRGRYVEFARAMALAGG
jgi:hypothetical protein